MINNIEEALNYINQVKINQQNQKEQLKFFVCMGTGCLAKGANAVYQELQNQLKKQNLDISVELQEDSVKKTGCCGPCSMGPLIKVKPYDYFYTEVTVEDIAELISLSQQGKPLTRLLMVDTNTCEKVNKIEESTFYKNQHHYVFEGIGDSICDEIDDYLNRGGYEPFFKILSDQSPKEVVADITKSGLRGRGGGGFSTGKKWEFAQLAPGSQKYVICNGDEGDPGAFMDRVILEKDPHSVIEGMLVAGFAIGANKGYAYIRAEYPVAIEMFRKAIEDATRLGFLGENILNSGFSFEIEVKEGAGAFVCGEETALIASIEGKRGVPRPRPPFPAVEGLFGCPTIINNVETFVNVARIIRDGVDTFLSKGTKNSPGTKMFSVSGPIKITGLVEVEFGSTLRNIIFQICGGLKDNLNYKGVQIGGPSGACLSEEFLDYPLDYESLKSIGAMVGSGGLVVISQNNCMVDIAKFFTNFTTRESCGKCIPCREGTMQAYRILDKFTLGKATRKDLETLEGLAQLIKMSSQCGLGQTAPNPILSTLRLFRHEYHSHIDGICPSSVCVAYKKYLISAELCKGCSLCDKNCPQNAISGERGKPYLIDQEKCNKCGLCVEKCKFDAIAIV